MSEIVFKSYADTKSELYTINDRIAVIKLQLESIESSVLSTTSKPNPNTGGGSSNNSGKDKILNYWANEEELVKELREKKKLSRKIKGYLKKIDNNIKSLTGLEAEIFRQVYIDGQDITNVINNILDGKVYDNSSTGSQATLWRMWKKIKI